MDKETTKTCVSGHTGRISEARLKTIDPNVSVQCNVHPQNHHAYQHMHRILEQRERDIHRVAMRLCDEKFFTRHADLYHKVRQSLEESLKQRQDHMVSCEEVLPGQESHDAIALYARRFSFSHERLNLVEKMVKRYGLRRTNIRQLVSHIDSTADKVKALCPLIERVIRYNNTYEPNESKHMPGYRKKPCRKSQLSSLYSLIYDTH